MVFKKKSEEDRRKKASETMKTINKKAREKKSLIQGELVSIGRRIVDLALLASSMWCNACKIPLSFRYLLEETLFGAASVFKIRCCKCLLVYSIPTSSTTPSTNPGSKRLYGVNCKFALGGIDSGVGHEQLNKLLSAVNLPVIHRNTIKLAEDRVSDAIVEVADQSCREAIAEEKFLTLSASLADENMNDTDDPTPMDMDISPTSSPPPTHSTPKLPRRNALRASLADLSAHASIASTLATPSDDVVNIVVKYDFGWDKRGNGFKYDSHSGRGSIIGDKTNKILGYKVLSSHCYMCARGLNPENHVCAKNYEGSAKGMEPKAAVDIMLKNSNLDSAGVRVLTVIGDKDSSILSALRQQIQFER